MKVPKIRKLASGQYSCQLRLGGVSKTITAFSEAECEKIVTLEKAKYLAGISRIKKLPKNVTLKECVDKYLYKNQKTLSPSTYRSFKSYSVHQFVDYQDKPIGKINWQQMIDVELNKVSQKTVQNRWGLVRTSLKELGYPVPKIRFGQEEVPDVNFLSPKEIKPFCKAVKGKPYEIALLLALNGLRMSELRGLTWSDIDLINGVININGARVRGTNGDIDKRTNKNTTSSRSVPIIIPQLLTALKAVEDKTGKVVTQTSNVLLDDTKRVCKASGLTVCTVHDLRRSYASLLFYKEVPMLQIQQWGGWGNDKVLKRVYIRISSEMASESKDKMLSFFNDSEPVEANC